ncbi:MAG: DUF6036 family nucleotidyltransferase [Nanoarchaeota archaeon]
MIEDFEKVNLLLDELNSALKKKVSAYIIGGAALLSRGMKAATKDIDIVVETRREFVELQKALDEINFAPTMPGKEYTHMNLSQIFQRGEFRIDLFEKEVCGKFSLSNNMRKRAEKILEGSNISVFLCSNEDIFLFKTMTERDGDLLDCITIATTQNPDWNIILKELQHQIKENNRDVWVTWVGERLDILEERGLDIPIMSQINILREKFFDDFEKNRKQ